jgi:cytochrome c-type biogenesis protein CcmH/NrfG
MCGSCSWARRPQSEFAAVSFWRKEVIGFALDHETRKHMDEQRAWIAREPANPLPYFHLAQFYRMEGRQEEALGLLLEAVRLDGKLAEAHVSLSEIYAVRADYASAWRHARDAESAGDGSAVELLRRYGIAE